MKIVALLAALSMLSACSAVAPGDNKGICERDPAACMSAREAMKKSDGNAIPTPSEAALQRGEGMRVWVVPMRTPSGVLTNSGNLYVE